LDGEELWAEGVDSVEDEVMHEVDVEDSKKLVDEAASSTTTTATEADEVALAVDVDSAGRITTSHSATVMLLSISSLIGRLSRRLTLIVWLS
jgi:hypothetical protein